MSYRTPGAPDMGALSGDPSAQPKGKSGKVKKEKKHTKRVLDRQILVAGFFAVLVVVGVFLFISKPETGSYVVRANTDIPALTPLTIDLVEAVRVPEGDIVEGAFSSSDPNEALTQANDVFLTGARAVSVINNRQQITSNSFSGISGLTSPLEADERLISVGASVIDGVAGQIKAGDTVDVFGTTSSGGDEITGLLASNIPVVSVSVDENVYRQAGSEQQRADATGAATGSNLLPANPIAPGIYVLRLPADVVQQVVTVQVSGKIFLAYRSPEASDIESGPSSVLSSICGANPDIVSSLCDAATASQ
jgi:Flp pilus assembly protein CpaB